MTKFMNKSFSVPVGDTAAYRDNFDAVFGKRAEAAPASDLVHSGPSPSTTLGAPVPADMLCTDAVASLLIEALAYVRQAVRVPGGPAEELAWRITAFLESRHG